MAIIGFIIAVIFFFGFWLPGWNRMDAGAFRLAERVRFALVHRKDRLIQTEAPVNPRGSEFGWSAMPADPLFACAIQAPLM